MTTLQQYRKLFEIMGNGEYSGHSLFATSRCDTEIQRYIPTLEVTGTIYANTYYNGVDKNKVENDINSFLKEFDISIPEKDKTYLINTIYSNLLDEVKYCAEKNK